MAEALIIIGGVCQSARRIRRYTNTIRNAPEEMQDLADMSESFCYILEMFHDRSTKHINQMRPESREKDEILYQVDNLRIQSARAERRIKDICQRIKRIKDSKQGKRKIYSFILRVDWAFKQGLLKHLKIDLHLIIAILNTFISMLAWEDKDRQIRNTTDQRLQADLRFDMSQIKKSLKHLVRDMQIHQRELKSLQGSRNVQLQSLQDSQQLIKNAKKLEKTLHDKLDMDDLGSGSRIPGERSFIYRSPPRGNLREMTIMPEPPPRRTSRISHYDPASSRGTASSSGRTREQRPAVASYSNVAEQWAVAPESQESRDSNSASSEDWRVANLDQTEISDPPSLVAVKQKKIREGGRVRDNGVTVICENGQWPDEISDVETDAVMDGEAGQFRGEASSSSNASNERPVPSARAKGKMPVNVGERRVLSMEEMIDRLLDEQENDKRAGGADSPSKGTNAEISNKERHGDVKRRAGDLLTEEETNPVKEGAVRRKQIRSEFKVKNEEQLNEDSRRRKQKMDELEKRSWKSDGYVHGDPVKDDMAKRRSRRDKH